MKRFVACLIIVVLSITIVPRPVHAQWTVFDPSNYAQAVLQVRQLIRSYELLLAQTRRLPVDLATRYHAHSYEWQYHDLDAGVLYARQLLAALNDGKGARAAYRTVASPLDVPAGAFGRMPPAMQRRIADAYSTIELADSIAGLAINHTGASREDGPYTLQAVRNVEKDAINTADNYQSHTALLQKIGSALAIQLRLGHSSNQFEVSLLEQALLDNKRKRDTEATLMNTVIHQWRYGQAYGADLFQNTAHNVDGWRPF